MGVTMGDATKVEDRRTTGRQSVGRLLVERQEMLVLFCRVAGLDPFKHTVVPGEVLQEFCQVLVDYMAATHFLLYARIIDGTERRLAVRTQAEELYPRIEACTETAIYFNDKYDCSDHAWDLTDLSQDLSMLGEALASRIELEDILITAMLR